MTLKSLVSDSVTSSGPAIRLVVKSRQRALKLCTAVYLCLAEARDIIFLSSFLFF